METGCYILTQLATLKVDNRYLKETICDRLLMEVTVANETTRSMMLAVLIQPDLEKEDEGDGMINSNN